MKQAYVLSFYIILKQSKSHPVLGYEAEKEESPPWVSEASLAEAAEYMKEELKPKRQNHFLSASRPTISHPHLLSDPYDL